MSELIEPKRQTMANNQTMSLRYGLNFSLILISIVSLLIISCSKHTTATTEISKYKRQPIEEVEETQLKIENMLAEAATNVEVGRNDEATKIYLNIIKTNPNEAAAHYGYAKICIRLKQIDSAIFHTEQAVSIAPDNVWYRQLAASLYQANEDYNKLISTWEALINIRPESIEYYYELANAYILSNNIPKAISTLNRVEKIVGVTEPISLQKQKLWNAIGKPKQGREEVEALSAAFPNNISYAEILAETYMKNGELSKAKTYYDRILAIDSTNEYIHINLAQYYKVTNKPKEMYQELSKVFADSRIACDDKMQILFSLIDTGNYATAEIEKLMDTAYPMCNNSTSFDLVYGRILIMNQKATKAKNVLFDALQIDSSSYDIWEILIAALEYDGEPDSIIFDYASRAAKLFPFQTLPLYTKGYILMQQGNYDEAIKILTRCEKNGFTKGELEEETYEILAECYHRKDNYEQTLNYYNKVLTINPDNYGALNNYAYYLAEWNKDLEKAEKMAFKAVQNQPNNSTFLDTYAWVLYKLKRFDEAHKYMLKAIQYAEQPSQTLKEHLQTIENAQ